MDHTNPSTRIVIAIDFGTSRSGYAYAFRGDSGVTSHWKWPGSNMRYPKTSTHLLYPPSEDTVEAWGYEAKARLVQLRREKKAANYYFFERFKMDLYQGKKGEQHNDSLFYKDGEPFLKSDGKEFRVLKLIADYLRCLKELALKDIKQQTIGSLQDQEILWCLTVPAIWDNVQKQLMREAAQIAGLITSDSTDAERLVLVSEPEAAVLHCRETNKDIADELRPGTCFMIVDAGGGTIDIIAHKVQKDGGYHEVTEGTGGPYGSTYVDDQFDRYLRNLFSEKIIRNLHDNEPATYLELMSDWETAKCDFDPTKNSTTRIPIKSNFYKIIKNLDHSVIERLEEQDQDEYIKLDKAMMEGFFEQPLNEIVRLVEEQFTQLKAASQQCDFIFLVGGFASSPLLQQRIKQAFGTQVKQVIVPEEPGVAVVSGAVNYGLDPSLIRARRTRMTYGIETRMPFDPELDPEEKKVKDLRQGGWRCKDRFDIFVKTGESVEVNETKTHTFFPIDAKQKSMGIICYASRNQNVRYVDEKGVFKVGELHISRDSNRNGYDWEVEVTMYFGRTEIKVQAKDLKTGHMEKTDLRFASTYFPDFVTDQNE